MNGSYPYHDIREFIGLHLVLFPFFLIHHFRQSRLSKGFEVLAIDCRLRKGQVWDWYSFCIFSCESSKNWLQSFTKKRLMEFMFSSRVKFEVCYSLFIRFHLFLVMRALKLQHYYCFVIKLNFIQFITHLTID